MFSAVTRARFLRVSISGSELDNSLPHESSCFIVAIFNNFTNNESDIVNSPTHNTTNN